MYGKQGHQEQKLDQAKEKCRLFKWNKAYNIQEDICIFNLQIIAHLPQVNIYKNN